MEVGQTALTLMRWGPSSRASAFIRPITPCFAAT